MLSQAVIRGRTWARGAQTLQGVLGRHRWSEKNVTIQPLMVPLKTPLIATNPKSTIVAAGVVAVCNTSIPHQIAGLSPGCCAADSAPCSHTQEGSNQIKNQNPNT